MDPLAGQIVAIITRYAVDGGVGLAMEHGQPAADAVGRLSAAVLTRLRADPAERTNVERFETRRDRYSASIEDALTAELERDPAFAAELRLLLPDVDPTTPATVSQTVSGPGAAASHGGIAGGAGSAVAGPGGTAVVFNGRVGTVVFSAAAIAAPDVALRPPYVKPRQDIAAGHPNLLLQAEYGVVPFRGRGEQLASLVAWSTSEATDGLALVTGPGGSGKSRLAAELCRQLLGDGWVAGFLRPRPPAGGLAGVVTAVAPVLVVVDDAETRIDEVLDLVELLATRRSAARWRIVLVARGAGDWWAALPTQVKEIEAKPVVAGRTLHELGPAEPTEAGREDAFGAAARPFAGALGVTVDRLPVPDLGDERFERPLFIQMAALSAVDALAHGLTAGPASPEALLHDALDRELTYWRETAAAADLRLDDRELRATVAVAALADAADKEGAAAVLVAVAELAGDAEKRLRLRVADWLNGLYRPGPSDGWLPSPGPDILAEAHVAAVLGRVPTFADAVLASVPPDRTKKPLTVLTRAARDHPSARRALEALLTERFEDLWPTALEVAQETGDPIGPILAAALERDTRPHLVAAVHAALPDATVSLRELALVTAQAAHAAALAYARAEAEDSDGPAIVAGSLNDLSNRLADLGRREEALAAIEEAVTIRRALAAERPDAFGPDLATSLSNLSNHLADLGWREEALAAIEEAAEAFRALADQRPDAFRPFLAGSLNNLSNALTNLGRREEALAAIEEAVGVYRALANERPDAFRPDLATSLTILSNALAGIGRRAEALAAIEESVETYRALAADRPDAFRPDLATSLNNFAGELAGLGRHEAALAAIEEAVEIYRALAADRPDAFRPDLARSLTNLSNQLGDLGRREEALAASAEAVGMYRDLAAEWPDAFRPDLAHSLNNLSNHLAALGRPEDALAAVEAAVEIRRELTTTRPDVFRPDLARSLTNLSVRLADLGRRDEALAAAQEAAEADKTVSAD